VKFVIETVFEKFAPIRKYVIRDMVSEKLSNLVKMLLEPVRLTHERKQLKYVDPKTMPHKKVRSLLFPLYFTKKNI